MMKLLTTLFAIFAMQLSVQVFSEEFTVGQKNKSFTVKEMTLKVGDTINFLNEDPFFHNVFSLSDIQFFDLGSYPKGTSKSVVFNTPGSVEVECAIHPEMFLKIDVQN